MFRKFFGNDTQDEQISSLQKSMNLQKESIELQRCISIAALKQARAQEHCRFAGGFSIFGNSTQEYIYGYEACKTSSSAVLKQIHVCEGIPALNK